MKRNMITKEGNWTVPFCGGKIYGLLSGLRYERRTMNIEYDSLEDSGL